MFPNPCDRKDSMTHEAYALKPRWRREPNNIVAAKTVCADSDPQLGFTNDEKMHRVVSWRTVASQY
jgi:hypothetical protein